MSKSKQPKPEEADGKTAAEDKSAAPGAPETAKDAAPETEAPETDTPEAVTPETGAAKTDTPETDEAERLSAEDTLAAGEPETRADRPRHPAAKPPRRSRPRTRSRPAPPTR